MTNGLTQEEENAIVNDYIYRGVVQVWSTGHQTWLALRNVSCTLCGTPVDVCDPSAYGLERYKGNSALGYVVTHMTCLDNFNKTLSYWNLPTNN
jgi:NAD-dependent dihydropyrimidine dehydrogenase PreA subunit